MKVDVRLAGWMARQQSLGLPITSAGAARFGGHAPAARHKRVQRSNFPSSVLKQVHAGGKLAAKHHARTARVTHALLELGIVSAYDAGANTASVQLVGSASKVVGAVAVSLGVPTVGITGKRCLVSLLDAHNPADGVLVATW